MIELPEAVTYAKQLNEQVAGKIVDRVCPPSSPHKFCWFNGDVQNYHGILAGREVKGARAFGIYAEMVFGETRDNVCLNFNDGVNVRLLGPGVKRPDRYQLLVDFTDGYSLVFSVAMYGSIICHKGDYDSEYYVKSRDSLSPVSEAFDLEYFLGLMKGLKPSVSTKAFLATEQRIPGLGNGCLQDILFDCGLHPKKKLSLMSLEEKERMFVSVKSVIKDMAEKGGRDTEKDLFGNDGSYSTKMSRKTQNLPCPVCGGKIVKEAYLGGAVYYCPVCQPL